MHCGHSKTMNCVPITKSDMGPDALAKICLVVCNTLLKLAKFYSQPNHADKVVGLCLYDCGFGCLVLKAIGFEQNIGMLVSGIIYFSNWNFMTTSHCALTWNLKGK